MTTKFVVLHLLAFGIVHVPGLGKIVGDGRAVTDSVPVKQQYLMER